MRKTTTLALIVTTIMVISAAAVLSHQGWRSGSRWAKDEAELIALEGKIKDAERPTVVMEADGKEYILHPGPIWYWKEKGYSLEKDQVVTVTGVVEEVDGALHIYPHIIKTGEQSIKLVDENGVPVWAGLRRGRSAGPGRGYGNCEYGAGHGWHGRGHMSGWRGHGYGHMSGWHIRGHGYGCGW